MPCKVSECDAYDCKYNSWRNFKKIFNPSRNSRERHSCTLSCIHISDGKCGSYSPHGR